MDPKLSWAQNSSWIYFVLTQNIFRPKLFLTKIFSDPTLYKHTFFLDTTLLYIQFLGVRAPLTLTRVKRKKSF